MNDTIARILGVLNDVLCLGCVLWIILTKRFPHKAKDAQYYHLTRVLLPACLLHYSGVVCSILKDKLCGTSSSFFLFLLCLDTYLIFDIILRIHRRRKFLQETEVEANNCRCLPTETEDDRNH